ncbi:alpha-tectorin-like [Seriola lalandi dorsalis]|nr:alpha-tectorin-like [Seriola lalandi dorsalis]
MLYLLLYLTTVFHFSTCSSMELCQGDNQCIICTATGPTVIDVHGQLNSVRDRCAYTLMKTTSLPDFQVHATFQERRRKDVSFLDRVILQLDKPAVQINLEQGGRVQLGDLIMMLNDTAQLVHGVELSKDQTGVTAKVSHLNTTMTVFFNGYTVQIHIKGPSGQVPSVYGLCGNSSQPLNEVRLSEHSASGCETQYEDTANSTINCNDMTERCNLLKEAFFTACHTHIDPQPYATACANTLCKYSAVDSLNCQFLEAYARACSLYSNDTMEGWRSKASCSGGPQAYCQDRFCSAHEFCGENSISGGTRCHCRAIFASTYRSQNTLGDGVVCNKSSLSVTLVGCLLQDKGIHYSDLHLYDNTCRGQMDNVTHMVTLSFDTKINPCGMMIRMNNKSQIINKNGVILETTKEQLADITCPFIIPDIDIDFSVGIKIIGGTNNGSYEYVITGVWNYTLTMKAYTDPGRTQTVTSNTELKLNQKVWYELKTGGLDDKEIALVTHSCFATDDPTANSSLRYDLIINGCANPADQTVTVQSNGEGTYNYFSFNMFQFSGKQGNVYLHCKLNLCLKQNKTCAPSCSPNARTRRAATSEHEDENSAIIIMAWSA